MDRKNMNSEQVGIGMTSLRTRKRLVEELKREGIRNPEVLRAIEEVPRHCFIEEAMASRAYDNIPLPIGYSQTISQPYIVAKMTEAIASGPLVKVLEIGTGSGYQAAILAQLAGDVYTIERVEALYHRSNAALRQLNIYNVHTRFGDGAKGWPECAPFDGIIVTAAADEIPEALLGQLNEGGRLIIPIGPPGSQVLQLITRHGDEFRTITLDPVRFVPFKEGTE
jgi:protein-L-isoaspartate(D-aspartate) O-methyltransferase